MNPASASSLPRVETVYAPVDCACSQSARRAMWNSRSVSFRLLSLAVRETLWIAQNMTMRDVLIELPGGEGFVRADDGTIIVTDDVSGIGGSALRDQDPYRPRDLDPASISLERIGTPALACSVPNPNSRRSQQRRVWKNHKPAGSRIVRAQTSLQHGRYPGRVPSLESDVASSS
jgi:hypothetical protein